MDAVLFYVGIVFGIVLSDGGSRGAETLAEPDAVRPSRSSPMVQLYYRLYPDLKGRNRYVCLVVKKGDDRSFILTGYLDRKIKGD